MFVLVQYVDDFVYYVCSITNVKNRKDDIADVKFSDGKFYRAKILETDCSRKILEWHLGKLEKANLEAELNKQQEVEAMVVDEEISNSSNSNTDNRFETTGVSSPFTDSDDDPEWNPDEEDQNNKHNFLKFFDKPLTSSERSSEIQIDEKQILTQPLSLHSRNSGTLETDGKSSDAQEMATTTNTGISNVPSTSTNTEITIPKRSVSPMGRVQRRSWQSPEKEVVRDVFNSHFIDERLPSLHECEDVIKSSSVLRGRTALQIKAWVAGELKRKSTVKKNNTNKKLRWTKEETTLIKKSFTHHLKNLTLPTLPECEQLLEKYDIFKNRVATSLKAYIYNEINRIKRSDNQ
ncbi:hypothetical protein RN001_000956 [Aquatica leii]|uniref:Uncharacterized protein n=1 Tax=Aquatica leii TaxID=1421715 RepID=A0AAN7SSJ5_9COLE|nr:hypothetical protein RN001_000956 [Aquatica leii]